MRQPRGGFKVGHVAACRIREAIQEPAKRIEEAERTRRGRLQVRRQALPSIPRHPGAGASHSIHDDQVMSMLRYSRVQPEDTGEVRQH